jgi:hypothetical protein
VKSTTGQMRLHDLMVNSGFATMHYAEPETAARTAIWLISLYNYKRKLEHRRNAKVA